MFKSWRSDKIKIKAVFKLQFQATQVPQLKKTAAMVSLVPDDVGKPTLRLEKAAIQEGACSWEKPVFERVNFIKESKTGKLKEKIYHFIVSTGSSKSSYLGEASIDFADFAMETEPMTVSLPLKFANSGAVLHVTIQKMQSVTDPRNIEENGDLTSQNAAGQNGSSFNGSSATLESLWDISFEQNSHNSPLRQNSMPQKGTLDVVTTKKHVHQRSNTDWLVALTSDGSLADSSYKPEVNLPRERSNDSIEELKGEISGLETHAKLSELELQTLRKQVLKESRRTRDLLRQIRSIKEERDGLKTECEQLKSQNCNENTEVNIQLRSDNEDLRVLLEEMRQELNLEKNEKTNLQLQLQKIQDSNCELILAVSDLNEMLEQRKRGESRDSDKLGTREKAEEFPEINSKCNTNEDKHQLAIRDLAEVQHDAKEVDMLKKQIQDFHGEIEFYRKNQEELQMHVEQLTLDYEVLKQEKDDVKRECSKSLATVTELESKIENLEENLKKKSQQYSDSLIDMNDLESNVKGLKKELEKQAQGFERDLEAMIHAKTEQEQRAIRAEEALRHTKWKNAITAERLQEEFKRLSVEMETKFDENEKLSTKALTEANELRIQKRILEEKLQKANEDLGLITDQNEVKLQELSKQINLKEEQIEQISLQLDQKSKQLQFAEKNLEEKHEAFSIEIHRLKSEIERLIQLAAQKAQQRGEMEQIKTSTTETEKLIHRWNIEKDDMEKRFSLVKLDAEKAQKELMNMKGLKDEKELMIRNLHLEVENLRVQYKDLKQSLSKEELEKDNLRKELVHLKDNTWRKEQGKSFQKELTIVPFERKEDTDLEKQMKGSNSRTIDECYLIEKERNRSMESELKEMQERYSEISLKFAEVEGERQQLVMTIRNLKNGKKT
ncbi:NT-C2 domain-containing protein [Cephalotus follicularis]|uniref:NT-C2 domain-containing protein n=1 Tax=Cephalotus follicularis TaxID=3775 RepID=A0A1Q3CMD6_CEPFO|nr:NT-C2 domain-containing protein [Cephalotus follicularis]